MLSISVLYYSLVRVVLSTGDVQGSWSEQRWQRFVTNSVAVCSVVRKVSNVEIDNIQSTAPFSTMVPSPS